MLKNDVDRDNILGWLLYVLGCEGLLLLLLDDEFLLLLFLELLLIFNGYIVLLVGYKMF